MINKSSPDEICFSDSYILRILRPLSGLFGPSFGHLPTPQAYLSCKPLNNSFSHHPQVAKRKQRDQLSRVFDRANAARNGCEALWQWEKVGGPFYLQAQGALLPVNSLPRHNKTHLVKKFMFSRFNGDQFKIGGGEGDLFHLDITFEPGATMTFAELP